jgi:hypothetical protein
MRIFTAQTTILLGRCSFAALLLLVTACKPKGAVPANTDSKNAAVNPANLYAFAEPALPLRDQPAISGKVLTTIPFGATVAAGKTSGATETIEGKTGNWISTTYQGKPGWVFSGFLSPIPLPNATCTGLLDYARTAFTPDGNEVRTYDDPAQAKSATAGSYNWQQKFSGDVYAEGHTTENFVSMSLTVPVRDDEIGFQICKRCTAHFRSLTYAAFKAQNATIKECGSRTSQGGCLRIWFIEVNSTDNGLLLKCGADSI